MSQVEPTTKPGAKPEKQEENFSFSLSSWW
jgi:hypothetical protein